MNTSGELPPPADFIFGILGKLSQSDYDKLMQPFTPPEPDVINNPTIDALYNFLNKPPNDLYKFLNNLITPADLKQIKDALPTDEFNTILNKLTHDERTNVIARISHISH